MNDDNLKNLQPDWINEGSLELYMEKKAGKILFNPFNVRAATNTLQKFKKATKTIIFMLLFPAFCLLDASEEEKKRLTAAYMCVNTEHTYYLVKGANRRLKHQVGVEEERAQERLRIGRQLGQDARQQQVDVKRVGQHVLHTGQQNTDEWTCVKKKKKSHG